MEGNIKYKIDKHKDLVDACAKNDGRAQLKIYDLYYKAMYNASLRIVNDTFLAEDIMQDSFIDAFGKLDTFEWRSSFGSWLKRIVINKSLDSLRSKVDLVSLTEETTEIPDEDYSDFENVDCKIEEIKVALKLLPENNRIILALHLFEGYDHQEIAHILDISYNNVRVRYIRAKRKLLEKISANKSQQVLN